MGYFEKIIVEIFEALGDEILKKDHFHLWDLPPKLQGEVSSSLLSLRKRGFLSEVDQDHRKMRLGVEGSNIVRELRNQIDNAQKEAARPKRPKAKLPQTMTEEIYILRSEDESGDLERLVKLANTCGFKPSTESDAGIESLWNEKLDSHIHDPKKKFLRLRIQRALEKKWIVKTKMRNGFKDLKQQYKFGFWITQNGIKAAREFLQSKEEAFIKSRLAEEQRANEESARKKEQARKEAEAKREREAEKKRQQLTQEEFRILEMLVVLQIQGDEVPLAQLADDLEDYGVPRISTALGFDTLVEKGFCEGDVSALQVTSDGKARIKKALSNKEFEAYRPKARFQSGD